MSLPSLKVRGLDELANSIKIDEQWERRTPCAAAMKACTGGEGKGRRQR